MCTADIRLEYTKFTFNIKIMYSKTFLSKDYKIRCPKILKVNFVISTNQQNYDKITNAFSYQNGALTFLLSFIDKNCYFAFEAFIYFLFFFCISLIFVMFFDK